MDKTKHKQRGVTLSGLLIWLVILILLGIFALKVIPPYIENAEISNIFKAIAQDPEMQAAPLKDIRDSYGKRAQINNISIVEAGDVEISKDASGISLSASYQAKLPLVGNATLLLEFNPSSESK